MKLKKMIDKTLALYLLVGVLNFIVCTGIMFLLYNVADVSKHFAPIVNYGLGSIIWYLSCNYLLFPGHKTTSKQLLCFVLDIVVCYLLSYYLIGPYVSRLLLRSHSVTRFFSFGGTENIRGNSPGQDEPLRGISYIAACVRKQHTVPGSAVAARTSLR